MCIIKLLIDKGVRDWPQYRRRTPPLLQTHACTQIHMMTGGAAEMKGLRRTAFIDQGYLLSVTLLNKRAVDAWGTFSQHRWHFPASAFHFISITVHFIYGLVQLQFIDSLSFMLFPSSMKHRRCCPSCTFPCNVVVNFQHHYSSLQCHMISRNHNNMLICSRNISDYYQCWTQLCCTIF